MSASPPSEASAARRGFPDPSITLVEFGEMLGLLIAERTERDPNTRRLVLKKVAYVRSDGRDWGAKGFNEVWIQQTKEGLFVAVDPASKHVFRYPSRPRYEVAFISPELFTVVVQCLKEHNYGALYELLLVNFGNREGFSVEGGFLLANDDYAAISTPEPVTGWVPCPVLK